MEMSRGPSGLVITRRWLRGKHFVMLAVLMPLTAALAWAWQSSGFQVWMGFAAFFLTSWDFMLVSMFVNSTTITVGEREIDVRHGPMPSLLYRPQRVPVADVEQLFAAPFGALFEVGVVLRDKTRLPLVRPVVSEEQALFVEQQIEQRLGLTDVEVAGELGSALPLPAPVEAAVKPGTGGALVLLPVLAIPAILMLVFFGVLRDRARRHAAALGCSRRGSEVHPQLLRLGAALGLLRGAARSRRKPRPHCPAHQRSGPGRPGGHPAFRAGAALGEAERLRVDADRDQPHQHQHQRRLERRGQRRFRVRGAERRTEVRRLSLTELGEAFAQGLEHRGHTRQCTNRSARHDVDVERG
jgi:hypothetical protein